MRERSETATPQLKCDSLSLSLSLSLFNLHYARSVTKLNKHQTLIYRDQFIQAVTTKVDGMTQSMANALFSAFDVAKRNCVHYATVLACCVIISKVRSCKEPHNSGARDCRRRLVGSCLLFATPLPIPCVLLRSPYY